MSNHANLHIHFALHFGQTPNACFSYLHFVLCDAGAKASTDGDKTGTDVQHGSIEGLLAMSF